MGQKSLQTASFDTVLISWMKKLGITSKELAKRSGLAESTISRYVTGIRQPSAKGGTIDNLTSGLAAVCKSKGLSVKAKDIKRELMGSLQKNDFAGKECAERIDRLINMLGVSSTKIAAYLSFDYSYFYRIRKGERALNDAKHVLQAIASYCKENCNDAASLAILSRNFGTTVTEKNLEAKVFTWLVGEKSKDKAMAATLLHELSEYQGESFLSKPSRMQKIALGGVATLGSFSGTKDFKGGVKSFLATTLNSNSRQDVIIFANVSLSNFASTGKEVCTLTKMLGELISRGIKINMIHTLDRPTSEMVLGLQVWVPLYMTGGINSYYLDQHTDCSQFNYTIMTSGSSAFFANTVGGKDGFTKGEFTRRKEEVAEYRLMAEKLLATAQPLVAVSRKKNEKEILLQVKEQESKANIFSTELPFFTLSDELLTDIVMYNQLSEQVSADLFRLRDKEREEMMEILQHKKVHHVFIGQFDEKGDAGMCLYSETRGYIPEAQYNIDSWRRHQKESGEFQSRSPNFSYEILPVNEYKHATLIINGKDVCVRRHNEPRLFFTTEQPALVEVLHPLTEDEESRKEALGSK